VLRYHGFRFAIDDDPFRHRAHEPADVLQRRDLIAESGAREGAERKSEVTRAGTAGTDCRSVAVHHCIGVGHGAADGRRSFWVACGCERSVIPRFTATQSLATFANPSPISEPPSVSRMSAPMKRPLTRGGIAAKILRRQGRRKGGGSLITETGSALPLVCFLVGNPGYADCTAVISWRIRPWARSDDGAGSIRVGT
jgi:hypothetical protein